MKRLNYSPLRQNPILIPCVFVIVSCLLIPSVLAADFDSGLRAFQKGDYATALKEWQPLALGGDGRAQSNLGMIYKAGLGVPQDYKEAFIWFQLAARQGLAVAQYYLGEMYEKGQGIPQDSKEAAKWNRLAAEQGYAPAQFNLGLRNVAGIGVPEDVKEGVKWYRLAAEQGDINALNGLGAAYYLGLGMPRDYQEAAKWYRMAAERGDRDGQSSLAGMYFEGKGVPRDFKEAVRWYTMAAEQGDPAAQFSLSKIYAEGQGVPQNYVQAHMWANLANANEEGWAPMMRSITKKMTPQQLRDSLAEKMTPQQLAEAQRLAGQWQKKSFPAPSQPALPDNEWETVAHISSSGTGFVCGIDLIATNYRVIQDGSRWEITFPTSGKTYELQLVTADKTNDLAVLKMIHTGLGFTDKQKPLQITAFSQAKIGEELYTIGFPLGDLLGSSHKVAAGLLSSSSGIDNDPRMFQISVPIQPGNSGGPIFNSRGQVIGILVSTLSAEYLFKTQGHIPQNVNFAIKSDYLLALIPQRSPPQKVQTGSLSNLSRADQVEVLRDSIGQVKTASGSAKRNSEN